MGLTGYQMGKTKVFLRAGQMAELDAWRTEAIPLRLFNGRLKLELLVKSLFPCGRPHFIYKLFGEENWLANHNNSLKEIAAIRIQKNLRRCLARKDFHRIKSSAIVLQTGLRAMVSRDDFRHRRQSRAAVIL